MKYPFSLIKKSFHNQEPWINVFLFKYITIPLTYIIVNFTKITPNIISVISLLFGLYSAYSYFVGNAIVAAFSYLISYVFDAIDGKVARITNSGKPYGAWFDMAIDRINLILISTAIAYNYYVTHNDSKLLLLNSIFLGLFFLGSESRYFISLYELKHKNTSNTKTNTNSKYKKWCIKKGVIGEPISLVEILLFYLIIAPVLKIEFYSILIVSVFLIVRILKQQLFWIHVSKH